MRQRSKGVALLIALLVAVIGLTIPSPALPAPTAAAAPAALRTFPADARVTTSPATGVARFVTFPSGLAVAGATPEIQAATFFTDYGHYFGITNPATELVLVRNSVDSYGQRHISYEQVYQGVSVFAATLRVHFNANGAISAVNGTAIPAITLNVAPTLTADDANAVALALVTTQPGEHAGSFDPAALAVANSRLLVYRYDLARGVAGANYLAYEVEVVAGETLREFVYVDAHSGKQVGRVSAIHDALFRRLYRVTVPGGLVWSEGDAFPGVLDAEEQVIVQSTGHAYTLFNATFGRDSYDAAGAEMLSMADRTNACPNASWNGSFVSFCNGVGSDDVVAHEWGHAYTEYTSNLIYQWQPGALNEAYSDIWGEVVDLLNGIGNDAGGTRTACDQTSVRWEVGEDATAFGGAIRDMWDPTCDGHPGKVSDTQYTCSTGDAGGVHSNSGVPNHLFSLLVDGGTYNGQTVTGIGLTKTAHIHWRAQDAYEVADTDFADHADALTQACTDLTGQNLNTLVTTGVSVPSGEIITAADCAELADAIAAVELRTEPTQCNFQPLLAQNPPPIACTVGTLRSAYNEDFEDGLADWTVTNSGVYTGYEPIDWVADNSLPDGRAGTAAYAEDPLGGSCDAGGDDVSGQRNLLSPAITIPADFLPATGLIVFEHYIATEASYDGGNLKVSVNGGAFTIVPQAAFVYNAHNAVMAGAPGNTSPLAGQRGWTGTDGGDVGGTWGQTQVNLGALGVVAGDSVRLRYDFGNDGCAGVDGWYVDDISIPYCSQATTAVEVGNLQVVATQPSASVSTTPSTTTALLMGGLALLVGAALAVSLRRK